MTSDPLTPSPLSGPVDECAALRALCDAATPGPWIVDQGGEVDDPFWLIAAVLRDHYGANAIRSTDRATVEFIAASRTAVPSLLARLAVLERENASLRRDIDVGFAAVREQRDEARAEVERLTAKLDMPCGSCHPCFNWADETWRREGRKPPSVIKWTDTLADLDEARAQLAEAAGTRDQYRDALADRDQELATAEARLAELEAEDSGAVAYPDVEAFRAARSDASRWGGSMRPMPDPYAAALAGSPPEPEADEARFYPHEHYLTLTAPITAPQPVDQPKCEHGQTGPHDVFYVIGGRRDWSSHCRGPREHGEEQR